MKQRLLLKIKGIFSFLEARAVAGENQYLYSTHTAFHAEILREGGQVMRKYSYEFSSHSDLPVRGQFHPEIDKN